MFILQYDICYSEFQVRSRKKELRSNAKVVPINLDQVPCLHHQIFSSRAPIIFLAVVILFFPLMFNRVVEFRSESYSVGDW